VWSPIPLVGTLVVVVVREAVEERLQLGEVDGHLLFGKPLLERAVQALKLAQRLRVRGSRVKELDAGLGQPSLEGNGDAVPAAGEAGVVV
jgi:hypothetical protein